MEFTPQNDPDKWAADHDQPQVNTLRFKKSKKKILTTVIILILLVAAGIAAWYYLGKSDTSY